MDEARSQLFIRKGLLTCAPCHRRHAWREGRAALSVLASGIDRSLPPAAPVEHEQQTGVDAASFDHQPTIPRARSPKPSGSARATRKAPWGSAFGTG